MTPRKLYTIDAGSVRALLKTAARAHTRSIAARNKEKVAESGSYGRGEHRIDKIREGYYARGIIFALAMLNGTAQDTRRRNPRPAPKTTQTQKVKS